MYPQVVFSGGHYPYFIGDRPLRKMNIDALSY